MQFMLALIAEERAWEDVTPDEVKENLTEMGQFNAELTEAGAFVFGGGLQERATGTTVHYGEVEPLVTDGPFAETKEVLGGYALLRAANKEEVVELTRRFLDVVGQGTCEIYQLHEMQEA